MGLYRLYFIFQPWALLITVRGCWKSYTTISNLMLPRQIVSNPSSEHGDINTRMEAPTSPVPTSSSFRQAKRDVRRENASVSEWWAVEQFSVSSQSWWNLGFIRSFALQSPCGDFLLNYSILLLPTWVLQIAAFITTFILLLTVSQQMIFHFDEKAFEPKPNRSRQSRFCFPTV